MSARAPGTTVPPRMKLLASKLSKPRRRIYGLLAVGGLLTGTVAAVGALVVWLGHASPDVTLPFWECGQYLLLLSVGNLGIYAAIFWQMGRLTRREGRGAAANASPGLTELAPDRADPAPRAERAREQPAGNPVRVSRQVRGTISSLKLDP